MGTYRKRKENGSVVWEPITNIKKTQVLRGNLPVWKRTQNTCVAWETMKTQGEHKFCMGTYRTHKDNIGFQWEHMRNVRKSMCCMRIYGKHNENTSIA